MNIFQSKSLFQMFALHAHKWPFSACPQLKILSTPTIVTQSVVELLAGTAPCSNIKTNNETHFMVAPYINISNFSKFLINWLEMIMTSHGKFLKENFFSKISNPLSSGHNISYSLKVSFGHSCENSQAGPRTAGPRWIVGFNG